MERGSTVDGPISQGGSANGVIPGATACLCSIPVIIVISLLTFGAGHLAPGGPFDRAGLGRELPRPVIENLNRKFHLDEPVWKQYLFYMGTSPTAISVPRISSKVRASVSSIFSFRAGRCISPDPLWTKYGARLIAFVFACLVGIPIGVISAVKQNTWIDQVALFCATAGMTIPNFVVALVLMDHLWRHPRLVSHRHDELR